MGSKTNDLTPKTRERLLALTTRLQDNVDLQQRLLVEPAAVLREEGFDEAEADVVIGRLLTGRLEFNGWALAPGVIIKSPWPPEDTAGDREIASIKPKTSKVGKRTKLTIIGEGFRKHDRVGFRRDGFVREGDNPRVDEGKGKITVHVTLPKIGYYDVAVGQHGEDLEWGFKNGYYQILPDDD